MIIRSILNLWWHSEILKLILGVVRGMFTKRLKRTFRLLYTVKSDFDAHDQASYKLRGGETFFRAFINSELGPPEVAPLMARTFGGVSGHRRQTGSEPRPAQIWSQK